jgi:hypothetical protein
MPRTDHCVYCGEVFAVRPMHPAVENDHWCAECLSILRDAWWECVPEISWWGDEAIRAEDV